MTGKENAVGSVKETLHSKRRSSRATTKMDESDSGSGMVANKESGSRVITDSIDESESQAVDREIKHVQGMFFIYVTFVLPVMKQY